MVSLSSGLAAEFPGVFERGLQSLRTLGLKPVPFPTTALSSRELYEHPERRVADLRDALLDESIDGIISAIGGYESVRLLPRLRRRWFTAQPKLIMGSSDATTYLSFARACGLIGFYGPSVMSGLSQMSDLPPEFEIHLRRVLFGRWSSLELAPYRSYTHGYTGWSGKQPGGIGRLTSEEAAWTVLQGYSPVRGHLWGGCIEVLEFLKATPFWPRPSFFDQAVLFLETSEEKPPPARVGYMLRNYGVGGVFERLSAILVGRPKDYTKAQREELRTLIRQIVAVEFGCPELPIITDIDFGHTDPKLVLPIGCEIEVDPRRVRLTLTQSPFAASARNSDEQPQGT